MKHPRILLATTLLALLPLAASAGKPHEHGAVKLDLALDGTKLELLLEAPLDSIVGFERAPRTDAERKTAADALARLRKGEGLFVLPAAAQCTLQPPAVKADVLEGGAAPKDGHADLDASFAFTCTKPEQLATLDVALFDAFPRIRRIDVQVAAAKGQSKATLTAKARRVNLPR